MVALGPLSGEQEDLDLRVVYDGTLDPGFAGTGSAITAGAPSGTCAVTVPTRRACH